MIERHCSPTKFDILPYGTIVKVFSETADLQYYIQVGTEDEVSWQTLGNLFDGIFRPLYEDQEFVNELLAQYQDCDRPIVNLARMIQSKY